MSEPSKTPIEHAVVIAGAGSTGLMLAGELALAGVDVAVVERRASQELAGSRAGGLQSRTIEVFDQRGIADRFLAEGQKAQTAGFASVNLPFIRFAYSSQDSVWKSSRPSGRCIRAMRAVAAFLGAGIMDRYPNIRYCILESGFGWLPFWGARMDDQSAYISYALPTIWLVSPANT